MSTIPSSSAPSKTRKLETSYTLFAVEVYHADSISSRIRSCYERIMRERADELNRDPNAYISSPKLGDRLVEQINYWFKMSNSHVVALRRDDNYVAFATVIQYEDHVSIYEVHPLPSLTPLEKSSFMAYLFNHIQMHFPSNLYYGLVHHKNTKSYRWWLSKGMEMTRLSYPKEHPGFSAEDGWIGLSYPRASIALKMSLIQSMSRHGCTLMFTDDTADPQDGALSMIGARRSFWASGETITISLLPTVSDTSTLMEKRKSHIKNVTDEWSSVCNINFKILSNEDYSGVIRISFDQDSGSWSHVGIANKRVPLGQATMNLGWIDVDDSDGTALHEFGHVLGMLHEHQHPESNIQWNHEIIYNYYSFHHNWTKEQVDKNILSRISGEHIHSTDGGYDENSIMHYDFPKLVSGRHYRRNKVLSDADKKYVLKIYGPRGESIESQQQRSMFETQMTLLQKLAGTMATLTSQVSDLQAATAANSQDIESMKDQQTKTLDEYEKDIESRIRGASRYYDSSASSQGMRGPQGYRGPGYRNS